MSELTTLFPGKELTLINGSKVMIKPMKFTQIPKALAFVDSINSKMAEASGGDITSQQFMIRVMALAGEDLLDLLAFGMKTPREWFDDLEADEGLQVALAFVEVNYSFFVQKVGPILEQGIIQIKALAPKIPTSGVEELSDLPEPVSA